MVIVGRCCIHEHPSFCKDLELERPIVTRVPVLVAFDLPSLDFGSEGYDHSDVLFPDHAPEILKRMISVTQGFRAESILTANVSGIGAWVAM